MRYLPLILAFLLASCAAPNHRVGAGNVTIPQLPAAATPVSGNELLMVDQEGTRRLTLSDALSGVGVTPNSAAVAPNTVLSGPPIGTSGPYSWRPLGIGDLPIQLSAPAQSTKVPSVLASPNPNDCVKFGDSAGSITTSGGPCGGAGGGAPTGTAGGDLSGNYPNPAVASIHLSAPLAVAQGGTAGNTATAARTNLGLGTAAVAATGAFGHAVPFLDTANAWSKAQNIAPITLTFGATVTPDFSAGNNFTLTLGGNVTLANPANITAGQCGQIDLVQDATGSRTVTWGTFWKFPGGTKPTLTTTGGAVDTISYCTSSTTFIKAAGLVNFQ